MEGKGFVREGEGGGGVEVWNNEETYYNFLFTHEAELLQVYLFLKMENFWILYDLIFEIEVLHPMT